MRKSDKPRLLFFVEAMGGGVFTYIVDLSNELIESYDMYIAYAVRPQTPIDYKDYFHSDVKLIEIKNFTRSVNPIRDSKAFFEIRKIANKVNPDVIHLHSSKAGVLGRLAFNKKNIPIFYTPHGYSFLMENSGLLKRRIYRTIELVCGKCSCTTISCSQGEHQESLKLSKSATYINNGINIEELQNFIDSTEVIPSHERQFTVFTLGRICYQKNPELFNKIAEKLPEVKFLWIGDGELRDKLTSKNIEITGWIKRKEALRLSLNADVFLLPSLWEGLPISLLEAMYMKKLCIVSNVIGNRDVIKNNMNGFVCDEVEEFVKRIEAARCDSQFELIKAAYQDIFDEYNTAVMAKRYNERYRNSLNN